MRRLIVKSMAAKRATLGHQAAVRRGGEAAASWFTLLGLDGLGKAPSDLDRSIPRSPLPTHDLPGIAVRIPAQQDQI